MKLVLLFICISFNSFSQKLLQNNEVCIYSFKTKNGKTMMLAKEKSNKYIVYRYGKNNKIELEFPEKNEQSWKKFTYSYYLRGGGKQNSGLDIDNINFQSNGYKYIVFSAYSAGDEESEESYSVGIIIYDKDEKRTVIKGNPKTIIGKLIDFRTNELLTIEENTDMD